VSVHVSNQHQSSKSETPMRIKMISLRRTYEFVFFCVYAIIQKKSVYRQSMDKKTLGGFCFADVLFACHQRLLCCHGFF